MSSCDSRQAKLTTLSRQELYDQVWQTPVRKLAEQFGVSDVGLAKICKKHGIPRPPVGYWAKVAFGKRVKRTPLPDLDDEALEEVRIFRSAFFGESGARATPDPSRPPIVVPEKLSKPHRLVEDTRTCLKSAQKRDDGVLQPDLARCLAIRVTRSSLPRALRITDTFIKEWERIGGKVAVGQRQTYGSPQTIFELHGDGVDIELSEAIKRVALDGQKVRHWSYRNFRYEATGRLILEVGGGTWDGLRHRWADGKRQRLENVLDSFVQGLSAILQAHRVRRLDKECTERQEARVADVRERAKQRRELEDRRRASLTQQVANWREAHEIRSYLAALSRKIDDRELQPTNPSTFPAWMDWATWYADYLDPLTTTPERPEFIEASENTPIGELDVTRDVRSLIQQLPAADTDELYPLQKADIEEHCGRLPYGTWNEICRVLEGLGYDVAGRYDRW